MVCDDLVRRVRQLGRCSDGVERQKWLARPARLRCAAQGARVVRSGFQGDGPTASRNDLGVRQAGSAGDAEIRRELRLRW